MRTRPWPIVILAILHCIAPAFNIVASAWLLHMTPAEYLTSLFRTDSGFGIASFLLVLPIAGIALYQVRSWSYPVFLAAMGWSLYTNFETWRSYPHQAGLGPLVAAYFVNLALVSYFVLPQVREMFFNPRMRWWQTQRRYEVLLPAQCSAPGGLVFRCAIINISEGGAFLKTNRVLDHQALVGLTFRILGQNLELSGRLAYRREQDVLGYGVQFLHDSQSRSRLRRLVQGIGLIEQKRNLWERANEDWRSLRQWARRLAQTGQGLVPETEGRTDSQKQAEKSDKEKSHLEKAAQ